jgi:hypothetical protein
MSGRRSHTRFTVASSWSGVIRLFRDAIVDRVEPDELRAISHTAAAVGEELSLDLIGAGQNVALKVRVLESRPVIVDGSVRHRIRLALPPVLTERSGGEERQTPDGDSSTSVEIGALTLRVAEAG